MHGDQYKTAGVTGPRRAPKLAKQAKALLIQTGEYTGGPPLPPAAGGGGIGGGYPCGTLGCAVYANVALGLYGSFWCQRASRSPPSSLLPSPPDSMLRALIGTSETHRVALAR